MVTSHVGQHSMHLLDFSFFNRYIFVGHLACLVLQKQALHSLLCIWGGFLRRHPQKRTILSISPFKKRLFQRHWTNDSYLRESHLPCALTASHQNSSWLEGLWEQLPLPTPLPDPSFKCRGSRELLKPWSRLGPGQGSAGEKLRGRGGIRAFQLLLSATSGLVAINWINIWPGAWLTKEWSHFLRSKARKWSLRNGQGGPWPSEGGSVMEWGRPWVRRSRLHQSDMWLWEGLPDKMELIIPACLEGSEPSMRKWIWESLVNSECCVLVRD